MIDFSQVFLGSSSAGKLSEYASFGLNLKQKTLPDAPEVQGTEEEVIIYKALYFGKNTLVEDTSLFIEGEDVGVNIKYLTRELKKNFKYNGKKATWKVYLGVVFENNLYITSADLEGTIDTSKSVKESFGFDSVFIPEGYVESLWELKEKGQKTTVSARKKAIDQLLSGKYDKVIDINGIPAWTGSYQTD